MKNNANPSITSSHKMKRSENKHVPPRTCLFFYIIGKYIIFRLWNVVLVRVSQFFFWFHSGKIEV